MKKFLPTPERPQLYLGFVFFILGGWCIVDPQTVESLSINQQYVILNDLSSLLLQCFGAQAVLVSIVIFWSTFTKKTYVIFGLFGSIPFVYFNYYFVFVEPMFSKLMLLDFFGNLSILGTCIWGAISTKQVN
ncbi:hypothetical protein [Aliiglaciecola sp. M165]|uniref:hypothetical protein n=1 Tax=Aliiglaciecola sp. M165 TaxID=2593649 RepID=UPI00117C652C|nr:hypothetical protein [Aliiglaciecola sp. M165]TRY31401.1 hypothetical protein FM019_11035 [Aliiglaciecola sp. M165]